MKKYMLWVIAFVMLTGSAWGQAASLPVAVMAPMADAKMPAFDVVSVKVNNSGSMMCRAGFPPDGLDVTNCPLIVILRVAYGMFNSPEDVISGIPGWAKSTHFDIEAKTSDADIARLKIVDPTHPPTYAHEQMKLMTQALLADRFKMTAHKEMKDLPVYDLVIAKGGLKMKEATTHSGEMQASRGKMSAQALSTKTLADWVWQEVGRTVIDKTGLTGKYDVTLRWTPEDHSAAMSADQTQSTEAAGPSIFTALQEQLGLKLESAKGPVETLVIDHVEMPTAN
jgi:uncharacterized protein (TIGR03435 family)